MTYQISSKSFVKFTGDDNLEALDLIADAFWAKERRYRAWSANDATEDGSAASSSSEEQNAIKVGVPVGKSVEEQLAALDKITPKNADEFIGKLDKHRELIYGKKQAEKMRRAAIKEAARCNAYTEARATEYYSREWLDSLADDIKARKQSPRARLSLRNRDKTVEELEAEAARIEERRALCKEAKRAMESVVGESRAIATLFHDTYNVDRAKVWDALRLLFPDRGGSPLLTPQTENKIKKLATKKEKEMAEAIDEVLKFYQTVASSCNTRNQQYVKIKQISKCGFSNVRNEAGAYADYDTERLISQNLKTANKGECACSLVHEIGHWIDYRVLGSPEESSQ